MAKTIKKVNKTVKPVEEKKEALLYENKAEPTVFLDKAVVLVEHDGLKAGSVIESTAPIVKMMVEKKMWRYATSEDF
jgi:hypothetical protein